MGGDGFIYIVKLDYTLQRIPIIVTNHFVGPKIVLSLMASIGDIFGLPYLFFSPHNNVYDREKKVRSTENFGK